MTKTLTKMELKTKHYNDTKITDEGEITAHTVACMRSLHMFEVVWNSCSQSEWPSWHYS